MKKIKISSLVVVLHATAIKLKSVNHCHPEPQMLFELRVCRPKNIFKLHINKKKCVLFCNGATIRFHKVRLG